MEIKRCGSRPSGKGPAEYFTGVVRIDPLFEASNPPGVSGGAVTFEPGDVVWIPPGEKHWHGASPTVAMTHIAIQEAVDGKVGDWLEKVSDEQYNGQRT